ncbi:thioesterase [Maritimibacter sp. 55A14]|uniref:PaaI family thioesterase n=1 Tax=Maritimibacter sp. 55A14 TaxID=2174844 RepID=UPI000D61C5C8|nr:PaaI family thioesterase [Maritimibacter sp. 55A14]PWE33067.1 thioesterase [Maritimibacter sp. 55A14]
MAVKMTGAEMEALLVREYPQVAGDFKVESVSETRLVLRMKVNNSHLRPGGTVSGPSMFTLVDLAMYLATMALIGPKVLAVTTNCSIDFMRKPKLGDLLGEARVLKLGRQLAVGDVVIYSERMDKPVARASLTYSIPRET